MSSTFKRATTIGLAAASFGLCATVSLAGNVGSGTLTLPTDSKYYSQTGGSGTGVARRCKSGFKYNPQRKKCVRIPTGSY